MLTVPSNGGRDCDRRPIQADEPTSAQLLADQRSGYAPSATDFEDAISRLDLELGNGPCDAFGSA